MAHEAHHVQRADKRLVTEPPKVRLKRQLQLLQEIRREGYPFADRWLQVVNRTKLEVNAAKAEERSRRSASQASSAEMTARESHC